MSLICFSYSFYTTLYITCVVSCILIFIHDIFQYHFSWIFCLRFLNILIEYNMFLKNAKLLKDIIWLFSDM